MGAASPLPLFPTDFFRVAGFADAGTSLFSTMCLFESPGKLFPTSLGLPRKSGMETGPGQTSFDVGLFFGGGEKKPVVPAG